MKAVSLAFYKVVSLFVAWPLGTEKGAAGSVFGRTGSAKLARHVQISHINRQNARFLTEIVKGTTRQHRSNVQQGKKPK